MAAHVRLPLAVPGMRIGIMGGSFNPAHAGHRHIALEALRRLGLDRVWWLVTPGNPLKSHAELPPLEARIAAAQAVADHPRIIVTGLEAELGSPYTSRTLEALRLRLRGVDIVWIMGADNLAGLHRWQRWRRIIGSVPVAVFDRPGWRYKAAGCRAAIAFAAGRRDERAALTLPTGRPAAWMILTIPLSSLSSTAIRRERALRATLGGWRRTAKA